jgi:site-specific recombinase XerC
VAKRDARLRRIKGMSPEIPCHAPQEDEGQQALGGYVANRQSPPKNRPPGKTNISTYTWTSHTCEPNRSGGWHQYQPLASSTAICSIAPSSGTMHKERDRSEGSAHPGELLSPMTLADFVKYRFIPEHVAVKHSAGKAHFYAILKHVITPEQVDRAFGIDCDTSRGKLKTIAEWPYLNNTRLCDVTSAQVQEIISTALQRGYSTQTVTHIRNVIRKIFSHGFEVHCFSGRNPASHVTLPRQVRRAGRVLTFDQLHCAIRNMRYPEREIALLGVLTEMSIAEICGLQWKYINLSDVRHLIDGEWVSPRTIAVRKQSYRSEFGSVLGTRKRDISLPDLVHSILHNLKLKRMFTHSDSFVFSSRSGTPINQDNFATRRLKVIGKRIDMPWLSWNVFHRTNVQLTSQYRSQLYNELTKWLPCEISQTGKSHKD